MLHEAYLGQIHGGTKDFADKKELTEIAGLTAVSKETHAQKRSALVKQVGNPYAFLCGRRQVYIHYAQDGMSLSQAVEAYLLTAGER